MKDVDDDFEVIEDDPLAGWKAVDRGGAPGVIFAQARFNFIGNRFELRLGTGRADHKEIGKTGDSGEIENNDVFGLLVRSELGAGSG